MTLGEKQRMFAKLVARLLLKIELEGGAATFGGAYRDPAWKVGNMPNRSLHGKRLAIDLNLFTPDASGRMRYQTTTEAHRVFGEWWEKQHPLCRWGGRFNDGNHYSMEHGGVK